MQQSDDPIGIGSRLRTVRTRHGLSQRALARRAGITNSTVSLIEAGLTNPSIGALKRILDAFPIALAEFFALEPEIRASPFQRRADQTDIGKEGITFFQIAGRPAGRNIQLLDEHYQPGADTGRILLTHLGEEAGVVIAGRVEVTVDDERAILEAGDGYHFESTRPHRFRCLGPEPCHIVSVCSPPTF